MECNYTSKSAVCDWFDRLLISSNLESKQRFVMDALYQSWACSFSSAFCFYLELRRYDWLLVSLSLLNLAFTMTNSVFGIILKPHPKFKGKYGLCSCSSWFLELGMGQEPRGYLFVTRSSQGVGHIDW